MTAKPAPARMSSFTTRRLTGGEIALARIAFAAEIDYGRVRVVQSPPVFPGAMVPLGREIVFGSWRAAMDFAEVGVSEQGWFVHELAHVWQATRRHVPLVAAKLVCLRSSDYEIRCAPGKSFAAFNIEAQAEIARFAWHARIGRPLMAKHARDAAALWPVT